MTLRQFIYRRLYLNTPGWKLTRWLRRGKSCRKCGDTGNLHLHHLDYPFFALWYPFLVLSLVAWAFDARAFWVVIWFMVVPDFISPMKTLCARCHRLEHERLQK